MGVPTFTIYNPNNEHVSNVTGALMKWCDLEEPFVCGTSKTYIQNISKFKIEVDMSYRNKIREQFLKTMNPEEFMKDCETALSELVSHTR